MVFLKLKITSFQIVNSTNRLGFMGFLKLKILKICFKNFQKLLNKNKTASMVFYEAKSNVA